MLRKSDYPAMCEELFAFTVGCRDHLGGMEWSLRSEWWDVRDFLDLGQTNRH